MSKNRIIQTRVSEELYSDWEKYVAKQKTAHGNESKVLRSLIEDAIKKNKDIKNEPVSNYRKVDLEMLNGLEREVKNIGNNHNQLTKTLNYLAKNNGNIYPSTIKKILNSLGMIDSHLEEICRKVDYLKCKE